jgi:hypothetical protein
LLQVSRTVGLTELLDVFGAQDIPEVELLGQTAANSVKIIL